MKQQFNDEELLGYLLGDCNDDLKKDIQNCLVRDISLQKRLRLVDLLQKQLKAAPMECYLPRKRKRWLLRVVPTCSLLLVSFFLGLYFESSFALFRNQENHYSVEKMDVLKTLNWDEKKSSSLI